MLIDTYLTMQQIMEQTGLSAAELAAMPLDEYARLSGRQTPTEAALQALDRDYEVSATQDQEQPPAPADAPQDLDPNSDDYFLAWRSQRARGGEGRGIFDGVDSHSDEYTAAVRQQAGRTAYSQGNVEQPARIERVFIQDSPVTGRTMGYR
jgi:hypothetical protein